MASLLYQTIEQISREKHIEPEIIVAAIEDAMVVAARKYYRTEEELRSKFNPESGQIDVFSVHMVVDEVADPFKKFPSRRPQAKSGNRSRRRNQADQTYRRARENCRADCQTGDPAKSARSRA